MTTPTLAPAAEAPALSRGERLERALFERVDIDFLAYFRVLFGAIMLYQVLAYFTPLENGRTLLADYYLRPFHFTYYGFGWVRPLPGNGLYWHFALLAVCALGILTGFLYRLCAALFCAGWIYLFLLDKAYYQNHYYLVCLLSFWMAVLPAHRTFSLDARLRPSLRSQTVPAWMLWALRGQIAVPYVMGGIAKISPDWLRGEPMRYWIFSGRYPYLGESLQQEWVVWAFSYGGMLFDLLIVPALLWRRTRWLAIAASLFFHASNHLVYPIGVFPWLMLGSTLIFFPPGTLRRFLGGWPIDAEQPEASATGSLRRRVLTWSLAACFAAQVIWPLRHHLYPGDAGWTGEGDLFAWRMMLYTKSGWKPRFEAVNPKTQERELVDWRDYLNRQQMWCMRLNPDMVLQFAHFIHREVLTPRGQGDWEVRAEVLSRYNGRAKQLLVDPEVNLAAIPRTAWGRATWVLPLTEPLSNAENYRREREERQQRDDPALQDE